MMQKSRNAIRADVMRAMSLGRAQTRAGLITSYDPSTYMVKVMISPELVETGWLQLDALGVGNGFGFYVGPGIGDQVLVAHLEDDPESGIVFARICDDDHVPPPVPSGEIWAVHQSQSFLKFTNDGNVALSSAADLNVTAQGNTTLNSTGTVVVTGSSIKLAGAGGKKVVLDGDPVVGGGGGTVQASSTKVTAK